MIGCARNLGSAVAAVAIMHPAPTAQSTAVAAPMISQNGDQPLRIISSRLEVNDKDHFATFIGDVHVVQGDSALKCKKLVVFYEDKSGPAAAPKIGLTSSSNQQIKRLEAKGGVVVTQKNQAATGDNGVFDMQTKTAILTGNVVITPTGEPAR